MILHSLVTAWFATVLARLAARRSAVENSSQSELDGLVWISPCCFVILKKGFSGFEEASRPPRGSG